MAPPSTPHPSSQPPPDDAPDPVPARLPGGLRADNALLQRANTCSCPLCNHAFTHLHCSSPGCAMYFCVSCSVVYRPESSSDRPATWYQRGTTRRSPADELLSLDDPDNVVDETRGGKPWGNGPPWPDDRHLDEFPHNDDPPMPV